ncbi:MAG: hypothetical protein U0326_27865 [Polyangiales bacterium]
MKNNGTFSTMAWAVVGLALSAGCSATVGPDPAPTNAAETEAGVVIDGVRDVDAGSCRDEFPTLGDACTEVDRLCRFGPGGPPCDPSGGPVIDCQNGRWVYVTLSCEGLSPSGWHDGGASEDASRD